ncbi:MAG: polysaccharide pyruvyl transferase family protein [Patescibacteria group bacterium]
MIDYLLEGYASRPARITLFGSHSGKNKGDVAILISLLHLLFKEHAEAQVILTSKSPKLLSQHIETSLPHVEDRTILVRKSMTSYLGIWTILDISRSDLILIGGGGLFFSRSLWNPFISHLLNIYLISLICRLLRTPYRLAFVGASHLTTPKSLQLLRSVLTHADRVVTRDTFTYQLFTQVCPTLKHMRQTQDLALAYPYNKNRAKVLVSTQRESLIPARRYVVVNIFDGMMVNEPERDLMTMARKIMYHLRRDYPQDTYDLVLYANNESTSCFADIQREIRDLSVFSSREHSVDEVLVLLENAAFIFATQLHVSLFSQLVKTPSVALAYDEKVTTQLTDIGCSNIIGFKDL